MGFWRGRVELVGGRVRWVGWWAVWNGRRAVFEWTGRRAVFARWREARRRVSGGSCIEATWSFREKYLEHCGGEME